MHISNEKILELRKKVGLQFSQKLGPIINRGNTLGYEEELRKTLQEISKEIYQLLSLTNPEKGYMTFHYSSCFTKKWHRIYLSPNNSTQQNDEILLENLRKFFNENKDHHTYEAFGRSYERLPKFFNLPIMDGVTEPIIIKFGKGTNKSKYVENELTLYICVNDWKQLFEMSKNSSKVDNLFFKGEELKLTCDEIKITENLINALKKILLVNENGDNLTLGLLAEEFANSDGCRSKNFIISCFFSSFIYSIWNWEISKDKNECLTIILVPFSLTSGIGRGNSETGKRLWEKFPKLASLNLAYKGEGIVTNDAIVILSVILGVLADELFKVENTHRENQSSFSTPEDVIRVACDLDNVVYYDINAGEHVLDSFLEQKKILSQLLKYDEKFSDTEKSKIETVWNNKLELNDYKELKNKFCWASPVFTNFLDLLWNVALDPIQLKREKSKGSCGYKAVAKMPKTKVIYLYSEPGCGKETISQLIHYFSGRYIYLSDTIDKKNDINNNDKTALEEFMNNHNTFGGEAKKFATIYELKEGAIKVNDKINPIHSYIPMNCAIFDSKDVFKKELFGSISREKGGFGLIPALHTIAGTLFLDEFNTMPDPLLANEFLRVFEEPYEVYIEDRGSPMRPVKVLIIIASNLTGDQLIEKGFNPAIVFRITKNYFHVPPLRQRKEDIAVFINHLLSEAAKDNNLKKVDIHGMRLLCELPWPDNYRGVKGLIDHILFKRRQKEIEHSEITYNEVLQAITERDVMKKVVSGGKTIQRIELVEKG